VKAWNDTDKQHLKTFSFCCILISGAIPLYKMDNFFHRGFALPTAPLAVRFK